jgi:multiple sugar transport system substrate-binding protein
VSPAASPSPDWDPTAISGDLVLAGWSAGAVEGPILEQVLEEFEAAYPNISVTFEPSTSYPETMAAQFSSGDVADVFYVDASVAPTWIDDGLLEPLDPYIEKSGFDTSAFYEGFLEPFQGPDGQLYGLPKDGNTLAMAYNVQLLSDAGVTPPTTIEELDAAIADLKAAGVQTPLCLAASLDRALPFVYANGGALFNADMTAPAIDSPESVAALEQYVGWFADGSAKRPADMGDGDFCGKSLGEGHVAIVFEGGWLDPYMATNYTRVEYQWAEMPAGAAGQATLGFTVSYSMGVDSKNKDASWVLISYLTGPEGMGTWTEGGVANPSRTDLSGAPGKEILIESSEFARPWSFIPGFSEINDAFNNAMSAAAQSGEVESGVQRIVEDTTNAIEDNL